MHNSKCIHFTFSLSIAHFALCFYFLAFHKQKRCREVGIGKEKKRTLDQAREISEVFLKVFWGFFHRSLAPNVELGGLWPPLGISAFNPFQVPQ